MTPGKGTSISIREKKSASRQDEPVAGRSARTSYKLHMHTPRPLSCARHLSFELRGRPHVLLSTLPKARCVYTCALHLAPFPSLHFLSVHFALSAAAAAAQDVHDFRMPLTFGSSSLSRKFILSSFLFSL